MVVSIFFKLQFFGQFSFEIIMENDERREQTVENIGQHSNQLPSLKKRIIFHTYFII